MREIKFRAWDDTLQKMFSARTLEDIAKSDFSSCNWYQLHTMQFTGLRDKDGKEIYELDYAEKDGCIYLVMWYKNKYILKDISNGDIIELDKNINVRSNYYENEEKFTGEYSKI